MRTPRRILLAAVTSAGVLAGLLGLLFVVRGLLGGETVSDDVEIPLELVGAITAFVVLVTAFSTLREAPLRRVAFLSCGFGVAVIGWLLLSG